MKTPNEKLILQAFLILVILSICFISGITDPFSIVLNTTITDAFFFLSGLLLMIIYIPITVLYFIRKDNFSNLGKIFRAVTYFSLVVFSLVFLIELFLNIRYLDFIFSEIIQALLYFLTYLILIGLLYWMLQINKFLHGIGRIDKK